MRRHGFEYGASSRARLRTLRDRRDAHVRSIFQNLWRFCVESYGVHVALECDQPTQTFWRITVRQKKVRHDDEPNVEGVELFSQTLSSVKGR